MEGEDQGGSFDGERLTLAVPTSPGSSFDTWARTIAPRLGEALDTDVVVDNQPGASGLVALNDMIKEGADGSTLVLWQIGPLAIMQLQGAEELRFDLQDLSYVGSFGGADHMLFSGKDTPLEDVEDLRSADEVRFASGTSGSLGFTSQQVVSDVLELDADFITGFDDQSERMVAIERGDADAVIGPVRTFETIGRLDDVRPVLRLVNERSEKFPDVPTATEVDGIDDDDREVLQTHFDMAAAFYTLIGPPQMPDAELEELRETVWSVANDEEFVAELADSGLTVSPENEYLQGDEVVDLTSNLLDVPQRYQDLVDELAE
nr:tripartite tricarboxylate transporter substrate-binding protein [Haloechinothrix aidingensis]